MHLSLVGRHRSERAPKKRAAFMNIYKRREKWLPGVLTCALSVYICMCTVAEYNFYLLLLCRWIKIRRASAVLLFCWCARAWMCFRVMNRWRLLSRSLPLPPGPPAHIRLIIICYNQSSVAESKWYMLITKYEWPGKKYEYAHTKIYVRRVPKEETKRTGIYSIRK